MVEEYLFHLAADEPAVVFCPTPELLGADPVQAEQLVRDRGVHSERLAFGLKVVRRVGGCQALPA